MPRRRPWRHDPHLAARLGSRPRLPRLRPGASSRRGQGRRAVRHGDDREAGRLRRARQHDPGRRRARRPARGRHLPAHRPQVVLLGADERRLPRARAGTGPGSPASSLPRVLDDGSATRSRCSGSRTSSATARTPRPRSSSTATWAVAARRRGPRRPHDHRHGRVDPARLRARLGRDDARRPGAGRAPRPPPPRVRRPPRRPAAHAQRARRPRARERGGDRARMRLAHAVDRASPTSSGSASRCGKFWVCKRTAPMVAEALECLGGNGYVEENGLARLYREAPLNSIWEGSGNVNALDVVRAVSREPARCRGARQGAGPGARSGPEGGRGRRPDADRDASSRVGGPRRRPARGAATGRRTSP